MGMNKLHEPPPADDVSCLSKYHPIVLLKTATSREFSTFWGNNCAEMKSSTFYHTQNDLRTSRGGYWLIFLKWKQVTSKELKKRNFQFVQVAIHLHPSYQQSDTRICSLFSKTSRIRLNKTIPIIFGFLWFTYVLKPVVIGMKFLLVILIHSLVHRCWELRKWSPKMNSFDTETISHNYSLRRRLLFSLLQETSARRLSQLVLQQYTTI